MRISQIDQARKEKKIMDKSFKKVVFKAIALAMGIASLVLSILKQLEDKNIIILLSIGLILLAFEGLDSIDWAII